MHSLEPSFRDLTHNLRISKLALKANHLLTKRRGVKTNSCWLTQGVLPSTGSWFKPNLRGSSQGLVMHQPWWGLASRDTLCATVQVYSLSVVLKYMGLSGTAALFVTVIIQNVSLYTCPSFYFAFRSLIYYTINNTHEHTQVLSVSCPLSAVHGSKKKKKVTYLVKPQ